MSLFGDYLKELIKNHNISVSELSRKSNVDRTMIHKAISDKRIISYNALNDICSAMRLTPKEEKMLKYYYNIIFQGEEKFNAYNAILDIFYELSNLKKFPCVNISNYIKIEDIENFTGNNIIFSGYTTVYMILRSIIYYEFQHENPRFEFTIPPSMSFFNNFVTDLRQNCDKKVSIKHIISFDADKEIDINGLKYLKSVLPICIILGQSYKVYYYYENNFSSKFVEPFPYFLVTHNHVMCFSVTGESVMLLSSKREAEYYHKNLKEYIESCRELITYSDNFVDFITKYQNIIGDDTFMSMMTQPCTMSLMTEEMLHKKFVYDEDGYDYVIEFIKKHIEKLKNYKHIHTIFSINGIKKFIKTGYLDEVPKQYMKRFNNDEIKSFINDFLNEIKSGNMSAQIYNDEQLCFPEYLSIAVGSNIGLNIFVNDNFWDKDKFFSIHISEPGLCKLFNEFFKYLTEGIMSLSQSETVNILEKLIKDI